MKYAIASLILLAGCALAPPVPQTPAQTVYAAEGAYIAVAHATADLLEQGLITLEQAETIGAYLADARPLLDEAIWIVRQGFKMSESRLDAVAAINAALQQILLELPNE